MRNLRSQRNRCSLRFNLLHPHPPRVPLSSVLEGEGRIIHDAELQFGLRPPFLEQPSTSIHFNVSGAVDQVMLLYFDMLSCRVVPNEYTQNT
nr:pentatricopeptide repeat-containing protein At5g14770, mitochondrial [Ipomoea trifida]